MRRGGGSQGRDCWRKRREVGKKRREMQEEGNGLEERRVKQGGEAGCVCWGFILASRYNPVSLSLSVATFTYDLRLFSAFVLV